MRKISIILSAIAISFLLTALPQVAAAQQQKQFARLVKIVIEPGELETYKSMLKEGIETALKTEPGLLALNAVYEKDKPNHVTIYEIFATEDAYRAHLQSPQYLKYQNGTRDMVKSMEYIDVAPPVMETKTKK